MKIDVYFIPAQLDELQLREKNVVVIDVLRAGTSIAAALSNGAKEVIPVDTVEAAVKISGSLFGDVVLLGGERMGKIIEGFHLGNSPSEYLKESVKGKSIVYTTTNGSLAIMKARYARSLVLASFVNIGRVVEYLKDGRQDTILICAGNRNAAGGFSLEDAVCAGMIIHRLKKTEVMEMELSDSGVAALALYRSVGKSISKLLVESEPGRSLAAIGFKADLKMCAAVDSIPVLPILRGSVLKLEPGTESSV